MKFTAILLFLRPVALVFPLTFLLLGCGVQSQTAKTERAYVGENSTLESNSKPTSSPVSDGFKGCWSNGSGMILRITNKEFHSSTNKYQPVEYEQLKELTHRNSVLLELKDRPSSYLFQQYIEVIPIDNADLGIKQLRMLDFISLDDVNANKIAGRDAWTHSDCAELFPQKR